jgi:sulfatase modifying factor 1
MRLLHGEEIAMEAPSAVRLMARVWVFACCLLAAMAVEATTQTNTGSVRGFVRDQMGAPVAGATVVARDPDMGVERSATTNADGFYSLAGLRPGTYQLVVRFAGLADQTRRTQVLVGQVLNIDFRLASTPIALEALVVTARSEAETLTSEVGTNITRAQIEQLPSRDRNFLELAELAPGARVDPRALWSAEDYQRCQEMARRHATPGFRVTIDRPFYIGRHEVTQAQWRRVMGTNPSVFQGARVEGDADRHPVDSVTWEDAQAFIRRLNQLDTTAVYRLPTEFEWEYAARAGAERDLPWPQVRDHAWLADTDKGTTHPVGQKRANAWGLHDMLGNVWEWVYDFYNEKLFADPVPPQSGEVHVLRGGSFLGDVKNVSYFTHAGGPGNGFDVGFRVVREVPPPPAGRR